MRGTISLASAFIVVVLIHSSMTLGLRAAQDVDEAARARVNAVMQSLTVRLSDKADESRFLREMNIATESVITEVDGFIASRISRNASSPAAEQQIRRLLMDHKPYREYSDEPFIRIGDTTFGRALVAAYTLVRGSHQDLAVIRGYRETAGGQFRLISKSTDFEGRTMRVQELRSPLSGEIWFLAWGRVLGANGSRVYIQAFAFDGQQFRVLWRPESMDNGSVEVTPNGFVVRYDKRDLSLPPSARDEYTLTPNGPVKISP